MKLSLRVAVLGLMLLPGYGQQSSQGSNGDRSEQTAAAKASPASTPAQAIPLFPSASETLGSETSPHETTPVDSALQTQIQDAFNKDPIFSHGNLKVAVLEDGIELSGEVASGRDRQNALRIAQSYARGKKVHNRVVVRGQGAQPGSVSPQNLPVNVNGPAASRASSNSSSPPKD